MDKEKNKKQKKEFPKRRPWIHPITHYPPVPKQVVTDDVIVRRLEFFSDMNELTGSTEGAELESLSRISHDEYQNYSYEIGSFDEDPFEEKL